MCIVDVREITKVNVEYWVQKHNTQT